MDTRTFLEYLWQGGQYSYFWTTPDKQSTWFNSKSIPSVSSNRKNVYFGIHPTSEIPTKNARGQEKPPSLVRSQNEHISVVNTLFAEFDFKHFGQEKKVIEHLDDYPEPSVTIFSGGGYHLYWFLDKPFFIKTNDDRERIKRLQADWVDYLQSDKQSKDIARVLRVPDTTNYKDSYAPNYPKVKITSSSGLFYSIFFLENLSSQKQTSQPVKKICNITTTSARKPNDRDASFFAGQAIESAVNMIKMSVDGEKHSTLLKAARLLGGYVAGGIIDEYAAIAVLENAISQKQNIDSIESAKKTIADGIEYGKSLPITVEQKLSEREEYFRQIGGENLYNSQVLEKPQGMIILTTGDENTFALKMNGFNAVGVNGHLTTNIASLFENCETVIALSGPNESEILTEAVKQITARGIETKQCQMPFEPKNFFEKYSGTYQDMVSLLKLSKTVKGMRL